jgi:hypothetical protein
MRIYFHLVPREMLFGATPPFRCTSSRSGD